MKKLTKYLSCVNLPSLLIKIFVSWFVFSFLIFPNVNIIINIFFQDGNFSISVFEKLLTSTRAIQSLKNSFILAISLVVTVNIVGTLLVLFTEYFEIKGQRILKIGYMTTLVYGGIVLATSYKHIYGSNGLITKFLISIFPTMNNDWFSGFFAVMFIMTFALTTNHIIFLSNSFRGLDFQMIEASKNMGASTLTTFRKIIIPLLKPTYFAITILIFLTGLSAVSAPLIVGGVEFQTINPIVIELSKSPVSRDIAALLAVILGLATIILLFFMNKVEKNGTYISLAKTKSKVIKQKIKNPIFNVLAHFLAYGLFIVYVLPIILVILYSFTNYLNVRSGIISLQAFTLDNYKDLFISVAAFKPYLSSIAYSALAAVLVSILTLVISRILHKNKGLFSDVLELTLLIPWLLPTTLIALGIMMTFDQPRIFVGNSVLIGTTYILLIAYIIVKIPFSLRMIKAALFSVDHNLEESALTLGANSFYTLIKVVIPIILPSVISVIALNFNSLLADFDLTVFLYHPLFPTLGIVIKNASDEVASLNAVAMSFVYTVVLIIISSLALILSNRLSSKGSKKSISIL